LYIQTTNIYKIEVELKYYFPGDDKSLKLYDDESRSGTVFGASGNPVIFNSTGADPNSVNPNPGVILKDADSSESFNSEFGNRDANGNWELEV